MWLLSKHPFSIPLFFSESWDLYGAVTLFWGGILAWKSCRFGKPEIYQMNLLPPTAQPSQQTCCYKKKRRYVYDNAFPWRWGTTEDIMTELKQAAVKRTRSLAAPRGLDFTTLKTIQLLTRCGIDGCFCAQQLTPKGPILLLVADSVNHIRVRLID